MLVLAHRGANRLAPENTVRAMAAAVANGADGVELDVHRSADGVLVVHHDPGTPAGLLRDLDVAAIAAAAPEVPTLAAVLDACRGVLVDVELKDPDPRASAALVALLAQRAAAGDHDDVLVSSFDLATVDRVHDAVPHLRSAVLTVLVPPDHGLELALAHGHRALHPDAFTLLAGPDLAAFVARAHERDVAINVWTVNDEVRVERLRAAGVDAVITDDDSLCCLGVRGRSA